MNIYNALPLIPTLAPQATVSGVDTMPKHPKPSLVRSNRTKKDAPRPGEAASLTRKALSLPDVRAEKIEAVKAAIADGSYHVDADDLAQALLKHMLDENDPS